MKELQEIKWQEKEIFTYVDFLADFRGKFHDIRDDPKFQNCLIQTAMATHNDWPENFLKLVRPVSFIQA